MNIQEQYNLANEAYQKAWRVTGKEVKDNLRKAEKALHEIESTDDIDKILMLVQNYIHCREKHILTETRILHLLINREQIYQQLTTKKVT